MTLKKQLLLAISGLFLLVFIVVQTLTVLSTRDYLQQQLASHAQDAATTLSKTLQTALQQHDATLAATEIASVFDRGYYRQMLVLDADGKLLAKRELADQTVAEPGWVTRLVQLELQPAEAFVSAGWRQLGKVVVVSHPAYAYQYLWQSMLNLAAWMLALFVLVMLAGLLILRWLLHPLEAMEGVANGILQHRFTTVQAVPYARELRRLVEAMNQMSRHIDRELTRAVQQSDSLRRQAMQDAVTGLENRESFRLRLNQLLQSDQGLSQAWLGLLELEGLHELNQQHGFAHGDALLRLVAKAMQQHIPAECGLAARLGGSAFALLIWNQSPQQASQLAARIRQSLSDTCIGLQWIAVLSGFSSPAEATVLMARADFQLAQARQQQGWQQISMHDEVSSGQLSGMGSQAWRHALTEAQTENRWQLSLQPVLHLHNESELHQELLLRLALPDGEVLPAAAFLPMVKRHQLSAVMDQAALSLALELMAQPAAAPRRIAVNIASASFADEGWRHWLLSICSDRAAVAQQLALEFSEADLHTADQAVLRTLSTLRQSGVQTGIDQFGLHPAAVRLLRQLVPDYLKIDPQLLQQAMLDENWRTHLQAIVQLATAMNIPVIAQKLENAAMLQFARECGLVAGQGFYLAEPLTVQRAFRPYL
ncbi:bifunctional diguanylate cyclase/phosphodiesterase [Undibacterium squillarum]|uniref:GGDEF domain-containing protein n=1 Tax=Undibacterium squillarum TaxID=1131567 RepID=A0ABQ2Y2M6_9BURK|nr:EAL domain-containing protein [Undibacterium squillarum]GGX47724.1 GGDEF domain-containing protein [Undibacterium squillarum]